MNFTILQFFVLLFVLPFISAIPVPRIITRVHTAEPVTTTQTYTTGTTTLKLPTIELFISNGVTYTRTLNDQLAPTQATTTAIYNDPTTTAETTPATNPATTTTTPATIATTPATTATTPATTATTPATTATTPATTSTTSTPAQVQTATANTGVTTTTSQAATSTSPTTQATTPTTLTTSQPTTTSSTSTTTSAKSSSSTTAASTSASGSISPPSYIVYSPYTDSGACKDSDAINSDLELIASKGIKKLRLYGTDCATISSVLPKASSMGMKVNQGFWFGNGAIDDVDAMVQDIITYAKTNGWSVFEFFTVGNEAINENYCSVSDLISKISDVKSTLKNNGFTGDVTTSEPPVSFINNPTLCTSSDIDFVGINPHSYFNANLYASESGEYIMSQKGQVEEICGGKSVFITETGYPSKGNTNGNNVPSAQNQYLAIQSIIEKTGGDVTILTTFNDYWKQPGPYGIEQYFGVINLFN